MEGPVGKNKPELPELSQQPGSPTALPVPGTAAGPPRSAGTNLLPSAANRGAATFVWGVWALMLLAAIAFVARYGDNIPYTDELAMVEVMTGERPITLDWLWSRHNEHRVFLPRLLLLGMYQVSGNDVRAGMFFNVAILGALSFAAIRVAKNLRGEMSYADAFFPLVLLHWGQYHTFLSGWQVQFAAATALAGVLLLIVVRWGNRLTLGPAFGAGVCLLLLALCGGNGLPLVPPLALWLCYAILLHWPPEKPRSAGGIILVLGLAGAAVAIVGVGLLSQVGEPRLEPVPSLKGFLNTTLMVLALSLGPGVMEYWPLSRVVVPGLLLASVPVLIWTWVKRPSEKSRALGLLMFLVAVVGLAMAVGWGRGARSFADAFSTTYVILAAPGLLCIYFIWGVLSPPSAGRFTQMCLFTLACALAVPNSRIGLGSGIAQFHRPRKAFQQDLLAGIPLSVLTEHHPLEWYSREDLAARLRMLKRARIGSFQHLQEDPPSRQVALPVTSVSARRMVWQDGRGYGSGRGSYLTFALDQPQLVYAIRLRYSYPNSAAASFLMSWGQSGQGDFSESGLASLPLPLLRRPDEKELDEQTVTIWVNGTIDRFHVYPDDKPYVFKLSEVVLLVPAAGSQNASNQ